MIILIILIVILCYFMFVVRKKKEELYKISAGESSNTNPESEDSSKLSSTNSKVNSDIGDLTKLQTDTITDPDKAFYKIPTFKDPTFYTPKDPKKKKGGSRVKKSGAPTASTSEEIVPNPEDERNLKNNTYETQMEPFYTKYHIYNAPKNIDICTFCRKLPFKTKHDNKFITGSYLFNSQAFSIPYLITKYNTCAVPVEIHYTLFDRIIQKIFKSDEIKHIGPKKDRKIKKFEDLYNHLVEVRKTCPDKRFIPMPSYIKSFHVVTLIFDIRKEKIEFYALDSNQIKISNVIIIQFQKAGFDYKGDLFLYNRKAGVPNTVFQQLEARFKTSPFDAFGYCAFWSWLICEIIFLGDHKKHTHPEALIKEEIKSWPNTAEDMRRLIVDFVFSRNYQICFEEPYKSNGIFSNSDYVNPQLRQKIKDYLNDFIKQSDVPVTVEDVKVEVSGGKIKKK